MIPYLGDGLGGGIVERDQPLGAEVRVLPGNEVKIDKSIITVIYCIPNKSVLDRRATVLEDAVDEESITTVTYLSIIPKNPVHDS